MIKNSGPVVIRRAVLVGLLFILLSLIGACNMMPEKVSYNDKRLAPLLEAIAKVDRASMGFLPLSADLNYKLESATGPYDEMLYVSGRNRETTIAFRKTGNGYKWIGEQEVHTGPAKSFLYEKVKYETIAITYQTENIYSAPLNQVNVKYDGPLFLMARRSSLDLKGALDLIRQWDAL